MRIHPRLQFVFRFVLVASLLAINEVPFWVNPLTDYEVVFFALSAIQGELCLFLAWGIYVEEGARIRRWYWGLLGISIAFIAAIRLLTGAWTEIDKIAGVAACAMLPHLLFVTGVFAVYRCRTRRSLSLTPQEFPMTKIRLKQVLVFVAGCAFLSMLLRQLIITPDGWLSLSNFQVYPLMTVQSLAMGLLGAPCAIAVLRPNRWSVLWLVYFVVVCAMVPLLGQFIEMLFARFQAVQPIPWPESYVSVVVDNITWYGPQLLPTIALFVLLRLSGVRLQEPK